MSILLQRSSANKTELKGNEWLQQIKDLPFCGSVTMTTNILEIEQLGLSLIPHHRINEAQLSNSEQVVLARRAALDVLITLSSCFHRIT